MIAPRSVASAERSADGTDARPIATAGQPTGDDTPDWPLATAWRGVYRPDGATLLNAVAETTEGYMLAGRTETGATDEWAAWLCAVDRTGTVRWHRTYSTGEFESATAVETTGSGAVVAGRVRADPGGVTDAWVRRVDADGAVRWRRTYGGDADDTAAVITGDGDGYRLVGTTRSRDPDGANGWRLALGADGAVRGERTYGGPGDQRVGDAVQSADGTLLAGATTPPDAARSNAWLARIDGDGALAWERSDGGDGRDRANAAVALEDGYAVAGLTGSFGPTWDVWLARLDGDGDLTWDRTYGGTGEDWATGLAAAGNGFLLSGTTDSGRDAFDRFVVGTDADGRRRWLRTDGGPGRDEGGPVLATADGGYLVGGQYRSLEPGRTDAWLTKLAERTPTLTPRPTPEPTPSPTPRPTPTAEPTPTLRRIDPADARDDETTAADGSGFTIATALAALAGGLGVRWRRANGAGSHGESDSGDGDAADE